MKTYKVYLESPMSDSFYATRAANSLDIDVKKKSVHTLEVSANLEDSFNVGLIVGASGSGKSTLMRSVWGEPKVFLDKTRAVIDQFTGSYDDRAALLCGIGLSSVPCWLKPAGALSNGQQARAEAALALELGGSGVVVLDEWTSVVDRTVAKVMSHCVQKMARRLGKKIVLVSCHYDVAEWLNPDWVIDCNTQTFDNRRLVRRDELRFDVREVTRSAWPPFSKYHYLSDKLAGGLNILYGLFHGQNQIGFLAASNYVPHTDKSKPKIMHLNRIVIHPDYVGFGLGGKFANIAGREVQKKGYRVMMKFSSEPMLRLLRKDSAWAHLKTNRQIGRTSFGSGLDRSASGRGESGACGFRENVKTHTFEMSPN